MKKQPIVILMFLIIFVSGCGREGSEQMSIPNPTVVTAVVAQQDIIPMIQTVGSLYASNDTMISSEIAGVISSIAFTAGQQVQVDDVLIALDDARQKALLNQAKANLELSEIELQRATDLFGRSALAQQELDQAQATFDARQAEVDLAEVELSKTIVKAPFTGRLGARTISLGDFVMSGSPLVNIVDKKTLHVRYAVPEYYLNQLEIGQRISLSTEAFGDERFVGKVDFIDPSVDEATRTITVEASIPNENEQLSAGLSVILEHLLGATLGALVLPEEALMPAIEGYSVYRVADNDQVEQVVVEIGARYDGLVQILQGLSEGDVIVVEGHQKLREGQFVQPMSRG